MKNKIINQKIVNATDDEFRKMSDELGIRVLILFGSRASSKASEKSDYDIAVLTEGEKNIENLENYNKVLYFLSDALNIPDHRIDLTNLNNASPFLNNEIARESQLIYGNEDEFATFKTYAMREYMATRDLRELEEKLISKRQKILAEKIYA